MNMAEPLHFQGLRGELKADEPMAATSAGAPAATADRFYLPADLDDLGAFLRQLPPQEPLLFVGLGSNLLVRDGGLRGTVVLTHAAASAPAHGRTASIYAEAGVASPKVARFAALHDLEGAEFLAGIPGCVGGALAMNAGCYGGETWDIVERVATIDRSRQARDAAAKASSRSATATACRSRRARSGSPRRGSACSAATARASRGVHEGAARPAHRHAAALAAECRQRVPQSAGRPCRAR